MPKTCPVCGETYADSSSFCFRDGTALRAETPAPSVIGEMFCDRYVVTDCIGEGGMGAVYLARDLRLPQQVAVKVLRDRMASDQSLVARFRQEAEAASRINHDRVARVFDFGFTTDGRAYIVMEYVNGRTLKSMTEAGPLDRQVAARITYMVAEGLDAAHRLGIIHRDLKPENVMIVDDPGGGMRVKVLDFGIAKVLDVESGDSPTQPGFVIGTPFWMSPEQLMAENLDARSDVFTLGLLAFVMLTGQRAFAGSTKQKEMMAPVSDVPRSLRSALPGAEWSSQVQGLFDRTLARDIELRPASALDFAGELSRTLSMVDTDTVKPIPSRNRNFMIGAGVAALFIGVIGYRLLRGNQHVLGATVSDSVSLVQHPAPGPPASELPGASGASTVGTVAGSSPSSVARPPFPPAESAKLAVRTSALLPRNPRQTGISGAPKLNSDSTGARSSNGAGEQSTPAMSAAHEELVRIMNDADRSIGGVSDPNKAADFVRRLDALEPRLTAPIDKAWAQFYRGTSHVTLGEKGKACNAFDHALSLGSGSQAIRTSTEQYQIALSCPP